MLGETHTPVLEVGHPYDGKFVSASYCTVILNRNNARTGTRKEPLSSGVLGVEHSQMHLCDVEDVDIIVDPRR